MKPEMITLKHGDTTIKMPAASLAKLAVASVFAQVLPPAANVQPIYSHSVPELGAAWPGQGGFNAGLVAARDDVQEALDQGYPVSTIWAHLYEMKRIEFRYETLLYYVNRHLQRRPQEVQTSIPTVQAPNVQTKRTQARQSASVRKKLASTGKPSTSTTPAGFTFNAAPNKEELL